MLAPSLPCYCPSLACAHYAGFQLSWNFVTSNAGVTTLRELWDYISPSFIIVDV